MSPPTKHQKETYNIWW